MRAPRRLTWARAGALWAGLSATWFAGCPTGTGPAEPEPVAEPEPSAEPEPAPDDFHDPLSTPEEPTVLLSNFTPAETCGNCHVEQHAQWRHSTHAYAMVDPVFRALVHERQVAFAGAQDQFCTQCHSTIGTRGGEVVDNFSFDNLGPVALDGVTCEACHKVTEVVRPYNAGHQLEQYSPMRGPLADPYPSEFHASVETNLLGTAPFCGSCHDVIEVSGLTLERPYAEFKESPRGLDGGRCLDCHMPTYDGPAAKDQPARTGLRDHSFIGVDTPLGDDFFATPDDKAAHRARVEALLTDVCSLSLQTADTVSQGTVIDLFATVKNEIDAHNLPTGTTFIRQMWLEVIATDDTGQVLFETGTLDANGDLRDFWSELDKYGDNDLVSYSSRLIDLLGTPVLFPWDATEHQSTSLSPLYERTSTLFIPTAEAAPGLVTISVRVLFRSHPPYLLRALALDEYLDELVVHELASAETEVLVTAAP